MPRDVFVFVFHQRDGKIRIVIFFYGGPERGGHRGATGGAPRCNEPDSVWSDCGPVNGSRRTFCLYELILIINQGQPRMLGMLEMLAIDGGTKTDPRPPPPPLGLSSSGRKVALCGIGVGCWPLKGFHVDAGEDARRFSTSGDGDVSPVVFGESADGFSASSQGCRGGFLRDSSEDARDSRHPRCWRSNGA